MSYHIGYSAERKYHDNCAETARAGIAAARACNALLTLAQGSILKLAMDALPDAAPILAEQTFEAYGWPDDNLDPHWLDEAGRQTWAIYKAYRGGV